MFRLSSKIKDLEDRCIELYQKRKKDIPKVIGIGFLAAYFYGAVVHSISVGIASTWNSSDEPLFTWDPFVNLGALFSPAGLGVTVFLIILYCLFNKKGYSLISGYKTKLDKQRKIEILPEGTHGTSGWMEKSRINEVLEAGPLKEVTAPLFGKTDGYHYVGLKDQRGLNNNIIVYGAPGSGKSRGFCMPFALQAARRRESIIFADPKAEYYETFSDHFRALGYQVRAYNLLDLEASDAWNCLMDSAADVNLVQQIAETIIRNTSTEKESQDFWATAEKNLLMALILYVQTMTVPGTGELLPPEQRSLGTIYQILASTSVNELDARFRSLPRGHPALPPYGIFRQAPHNIWGNIFVGLGSRLNVFQNKLVDSITKYNEIDLERPGKQPCAYFCIISDQDSSLRFLSSLFFSLLFVRLSNSARKQENRKLPVTVNVLLDEFCNIDVIDFKKILSTARSRNINIQCVVQSVAQLADRYPKTEWEEIVGDCDYQLLLGCNDKMTADFWSAQCGDVTVRVNNANVPMTPLFSPILNTTRPYMHAKTSTGRPLMMADEVRRLPRDQVLFLMRGELPLKLCKIVPEEHPDFEKLKAVKAVDYIPEWRKEKEEPCATVAQSPSQDFEVRIPKPEESGEYIPSPEELDLHPPIDLTKGIDCKTLTQVSPDEI